MAFPSDIPGAITAIGALGTAAFALVDVAKIGKNGGPSNAGFDCIEAMVKKMLPGVSRSKSGAPGNKPSLLDQLHANWINGVKLTDQKAIAKTSLKIYLDSTTAPKYAEALGLGAQISTLNKLIGKLNGDPKDKENSLTTEESHLHGKFDFLLSLMIDEAYQRADQHYRNRSKALAMLIAIVLAILGGYSLESDQFWKLDNRYLWQSIIAGLLACPLAPVAKDLASALQAGVKVAQTLRK